MPTMVETKCKNCRAPMSVREADRKRGWGKFCSKSCKAAAQARRTGWAGPGSGPRPGRRGSGRSHNHDPRRDGIWRDGKRVRCATCGAHATNGVVSGFLANTPIDPVHGVPIEWTCDLHFDDADPLSGEALGQW